MPGKDDELKRVVAVLELNLRGIKFQLPGCAATLVRPTSIKLGMYVYLK